VESGDFTNVNKIIEAFGSSIEFLKEDLIEFKK
jgi:hypothetical protein